MSSSRTRLMFLFAILFAGLAAWLANLWVQQRIAVAGDAPQTVQVVVSALDVPQGQQLSKHHLKMIDWPADLKPTGSLSKLEDALDKIARQPLTMGDVITDSKLAKPGDGSYLSALVGENKRAVTVRVDDVVGVAGFILPGNHVDVLAAKIERVGQNVTVRTVLEDVVVLAVDQELSPDNNKPKIVRAVTLELTPIQSESIVKASHEGKIQLALRNPNDRNAIVKQLPIVTAKAKTQPRVAAPTKVTPITPTPAPISMAKTEEGPKVTIIRGLQVTEEEPTVAPEF